MIKEIIGKKGYKTYTYNDKYIYSLYDPYNEANKYISTISLKENIITYCGADYINKVLSENINVKNIFSIEIESDIFFKDPSLLKVKRINKEEEIEKVIQIHNLTPENCSIILWKDFITINYEIKKNIIEKIKYFLIKNSLNNININSFEKLEQKNIEKNLKKLSNIKYLVKDATFLKNAPSIIISSGNFLKENVELIKEIQKKFLIFSYPSCLEYLQNNDINIDYVIAVDPGYATFYHLYKYKKNVKLITTLSITPSVLNLKNYDFYFFNYGSKKEYQIFKDENVLTSLPEGSVAFNLFNILLQFGCEEIILFGQDFCNYENKSHIKGGNFENEFILKSNFFDSYEKINYLHNLKRIKTQIEIDGEVFDTETSFYIYYNHFISNIEKYKNIKITGKILHNYSNKIKYIDTEIVKNYKDIKKITLPFKEININ